jgi:hypothetical protein
LLIDLDFLGIVIGNIPHKGIFKMLNYQDWTSLSTAVLDITTYG